MTVFGGVHVDIDWTEEGFGSATDAQSDVYSLTCSRGIGSAAQEGFVAAAGDATVTLVNRDGKYSRHNSASALYPNVRGKKPIRLRLSSPLSKVFWVGQIDKIRAGARIDGAPTVVLSCKGNFIRLTDGRKLTPVANGGDTSDIALTALLTSAGFASGEMDIDTGDITMGVWGPVEVAGLEEARKIVGTELGKFFEASDGKATFERRSYRRDTTRSNTSQMTLSDDPGDSAVYRYRGIDQADPEENIYDRIVVNFTPTFTVDGSPVVIFQLGGPLIASIVIPPGSSRQVTFNPFVYPFLYPSGTPQADQTGRYYVTDWEDPTVSGGDPDLLVTDIPGVDAPQSALSISNILTTTHSITFTLSNSDPSLDLVMGIVRLRGQRGVIGAPVRQVVGSGLREYPLPGPYYPSSGPANTAARWLYDYYSAPRDLLIMNLSGVRSPTLLTSLMGREISDRIHVQATESHTNLALDHDFFLEGVAWQFQHGGDIDCTLSLSACLPNTQDTENDLAGLPTGMAPYYPMEESSGAVNDITPLAYHLSRNGTVTGVGIVGRGQVFAGADNDYLINLTNDLPDTDFANTHEWCGWIKRDAGSWTPDQIVLQKDIGDPDFAYRIFLVQAAGNQYVEASITTTGGVFTVASNVNILTTGVFHFVRFIHDATNLRIGLSVDLGTMIYETYTGTPVTFTDGLVLGGSGGGGGGVSPIFDASSSRISNGGATTETWAHTCTGTDLVLFVQTEGTTTITGVTYGGVALTLAASHDPGGGQPHYLWYLIAPAVGTANIIVTRSSAVGTFAGQGLSYTGADQSTPYGTISTVQFGVSPADPDDTISSATDELVVQAVGWAQTVSTTVSVGSGQTQRRLTFSGTTPTHRGLLWSDKAGAASVHMTADLTANKTGSTFTFPLLPASAGATSLYPLNATLDEWGYLAGRILTDAEAITVYNGGLGITATGDSSNSFVPTVPSTPPVNVPAGPVADRPSVAGSGQLYFASDVNGGTLYRWNDTLVDWEQIAPGLTEAILNAIIDAKGDLIAGTAADTPARVAVGTDGYLLKADSGATPGVSWVTPVGIDTGAIQKSLVDAKGDLLAASADNTVARLAVGADGKSLVADSSTSTGLAWESRTLLTNGSTSAPELLFDPSGDVIYG